MNLLLAYLYKYIYFRYIMKLVCIFRKLFIHKNVIVHLLHLLLSAFIDGQILCKTSKTAIQISGQDFAGTSCVNWLSRGWNNINFRYLEISIAHLNPIYYLYQTKPRMQKLKYLKQIVIFMQTYN